MTKQEQPLSEKYRKRARNWLGAVLAFGLGVVGVVIDAGFLTLNEYQYRQELNRQYGQILKPYNELREASMDIGKLSRQLSDVANNKLFNLLEQAEQEAFDSAKKIVDDNKEAFVEYEKQGKAIEQKYQKRKNIGGGVLTPLVFLIGFSYWMYHRNELKLLDARAREIAEKLNF